MQTKREGDDNDAKGGGHGNGITNRKHMITATKWVRDWLSGWKDGKMEG